MRICFIAHGKFTHIDAYLDYFSRHGHDVSFVALAPGPNRSVPTYSAGFGMLGKWGYLAVMLRARKIVRSFSPDIVHAHYATSAGLAAYVCGVHPYIVTAHGTDVTRGAESAFWRPVLRQIFKNAAYVNPVSDNLREMVLGLGIPAGKVETLTLGIETSRFVFQGPQQRKSSASLRFICTRRLEEVYDHRTIIKGVGILARQGMNFKVSFVGDGPMRAPLQNLAEKEGVADKIIFVGMVPNSRLPELLADHDIYLSAALQDGASLSLLEAMASGVYPVVSNINANKLWIRHGYNGLLHEVASPVSFAQCLSAAIRETGSLQNALSTNRLRVLENGDRIKNMQRLEQIYRSIL